MANDFSGDANCLALYRFENTEPEVDSKGSNTLSILNSVASNVTEFKEGAASTVVGISDGLFLTDAALPADWPFKNGTSNMIFGFVGWIRPTIIPGVGNNDDIVAKHNYVLNSGTFALRMRDSRIQLETRYGATDYEYTDICGISAINQWYHLGFCLNGTTGAWLLRFWDDVLAVATTYSGTLANKPLLVGDAHFAFFMERYNATWTNFYNGEGDEFVIFNRWLSVKEIDDIRDQIFPVSLKVAGVVNPATVAGSNYSKVCGVSKV